MSDLTQLSDGELCDEAESAIIAASIMAATPDYQKRLREVYDECHRRGKGIYQRAWNRAARSQGYEGMAEPVKEGSA